MMNHLEWPQTDKYKTNNDQELSRTNKFKVELMDFKKETENLLRKKNYVEIGWPPTTTFWWIILDKTASYSKQLESLKIEKPVSPHNHTATYENALVMKPNWEIKNENHYETYYTDKNPNFKTNNIERRIRSILNKDRERQNLPKIPANQKVIQRAADDTLRDINWYIIVAANLTTYPRGTLIMTTLWPWRVYDTWRLASHHIDIYTHRDNL